MFRLTLVRVDLGGRSVLLLRHRALPDPRLLLGSHKARAFARSPVESSHRVRGRSSRLLVVLLYGLGLRSESSSGSLGGNVRGLGIERSLDGSLDAEHLAEGVLRSGVD